MLISVVIPVFNVEPFLPQCVDSVLAQSFCDFEVILIDDGSQDNSGMICDAYADKDSRVKVIHQVNAGEGAARNAGLAAARGEWVFFLDGDDVMLAGALDRLRKVISDDSDVIRFDFCRFNDGESPEVPQPFMPLSINVVDISHEIQMDEFFAYVWQHVYRRSLIDGMKFKKYKRGCDRVFLDDVLLNKADSVKVVDGLCYGYRLRGGSAMNSRPSLQVLRDEMDHRLDIMEMIDASGKKVLYAGNDWLEGYFTHKLPMLALDRHDDARAIRVEWRMRLPRLLKCKGLSQRGKRYVGLSANPLLRPIGDFFIFSLPYLRHKSPLLKPFTRLYRYVMRHGEFA